MQKSISVQLESSGKIIDDVALKKVLRQRSAVLTRVIVNHGDLHRCRVPQPGRSSGFHFLTSFYQGLDLRHPNIRLPSWRRHRSARGR